MRNALNSLRVRIFLLFTLAAAVLIGTMGFHATAERQMRLEFVRERLQDTAKLIAAQHNHAVEEAQELLDTLTRAQTAHLTILPKNCQRELAQRLQQDPQFENIILALPDGSVVCSAIPGAKRIDSAAQRYFQLALMSPGVVIGEANTSPITGKRRLPFAKAVRDSGGHALGAIEVSLDLSGLARELADATYPEGASIGLIDAKGRVLLRHPDTEGWVGKDASGSSFFKAVEARGGNGSFEEIGITGVRRVYGLARFAETAAGPMSLWLGVDKKTVTADIERDFVWTVLAAVGLLLVTFAAMWAGGERLLVCPFARLAEAARRLGQGDVSARTGLAPARDEFGRLAQSFDDTASALEAKDRHVVLANRTVRVLSAWNQAMLTPRDETSLIASMCRSIVEEGGYRCAWVGFAMYDKNKTVEPVAWWGMEARDVASLGITWADTPRGRSAAGTAIRRGAVVTVNDCLSNPDTEPRRENALHRQYGAVMSLPLKVDDAVIGALTICAAESESFGEQEAVLLSEVAAALSSGIGALRARAARTHLEASLRTSKGRFRAASEARPDALLVLKRVPDAAGNLVDFEVTDANGRARALGLAKGEVIGQTLFQLLPMYRYRTAVLFRKYAQVLATGMPLEEEFPFDVLGAERKWFRQQVVAVENGVAVSLRDITAWKTAGDKMQAGGEMPRLAMAGAQMGAWNAHLESDTHSLAE